ncbi:hypothetical protein GCM10011316_15630 [Roseibium aquae]|uniref:SCP domain-containing protein n=1 Tax=Roseibium aquae TaxID=1323746 RepID=A0A916TJH9_9HYPH|nr:CAP domain-containing protein [Roseibium aquae]GGB44479.1 hypothetical protein GCM10011316_15630 [Roseibium aquae]
MTNTRSIPVVSRRLLLVLAGITVFTSCSALSPSGDLTGAAEITTVPVDTQDLLQMLNAYRAAHALPPLRIDGTLNVVSLSMARHIAERDSMKTREHSPQGLSNRLSAAGYPNYAAAENLGAGYASLAAAFAGWQGSDGHDKNLLNPYVTRAGIGRTRRSNGKWRNFWVLTLARPEADGRPVLR